jgi:hypothetical protein
MEDGLFRNAWRFCRLLRFESFFSLRYKPPRVRRGKIVRQPEVQKITWERSRENRRGKALQTLNAGSRLNRVLLSPARRPWEVATHQWSLCRMRIRNPLGTGCTMSRYKDYPILWSGSSSIGQPVVLTRRSF